MLKKSYLIIGYKKTGKSLSLFLKNKGKSHIVYDENEKHEQVVNDVKQIDFSSVLVAICSPGVSQDSEIIKICKNKNIKVLSDIEFAKKHVKGKYIAITGTNGKTTVCSLLYHTLKQNNYNVFIAGNIGEPLVNLYKKTNKRSIIILEISSYMLEIATYFKPQISCILNISDDHLNRHKTIENYAFIKSKIFKFQSKHQHCVLNFDNIYTKKLATLVKSRVLFYSIQNKVKGAYAKNGEVFSWFNNKHISILNYRRCKLIGNANLSNTCAVVEILKILHLKNEQIQNGIYSFIPLEHRYELIGAKNGIKFINDSKATNTSSTISAINNLEQSAVIMLGGQAKKQDFADLFKLKNKNIKKYVIYGQDKSYICKFAKKYGVKFIEADTFKNAFDKSVELAQKDEIVLLSPSCASFDEFKNFEERGEYFKQLYEQI